MKVVSHAELVTLIKKTYQSKIPLYIWGATGIGKSETVNQAGKELSQILKDPNFQVVDVRLSQFDPSDLRGLPIIKDNKTSWALPDWLPTTGRGILFFDEINLAPPLVQASAYQLILDRKLGNYTLPEGWVIIAAGNRGASDKAYTFDLSGPLCNRFVHVELQIPDIESWTKWAIENQVDNRIITFLNFKPSLLYQFDEQLKDKAFPTPRTWAKYCSPLIQDVTDFDTLHTLISTAVGVGAATEFITYLKLSRNRTINWESVLENPASIKDIKGLDMKFTLISGLAEKVKANKKLLEKVMECCEYLEPELAILLLRLLKQQVSDLPKIIQSNPKLINICKKFIKYLIE